MNKQIFDYAQGAQNIARGAGDVINKSLDYINPASNDRLNNEFDIIEIHNSDRDALTIINRLNSPLAKDLGSGHIRGLVAVEALLFYGDNIDKRNDPLGLAKYVNNLENSDSPYNMQGFLRDLVGTGPGAGQSLQPLSGFELRAEEDRDSSGAWRSARSPCRHRCRSSIISQPWTIRASIGG